MAQQTNIFSKVVQKSSQKLKEYRQSFHQGLHSGTYHLFDSSAGAKADKLVDKANKETDKAGKAAGKDTRTKILRSSLELIAQKHTTDISVREIAQHANVNVASVNYHFHSKNRMLDELFCQVIKGFDRLFFLLESQSLSPEHCLVRWADRFMRYLLLYPGALIIVRDSPKWKGITQQVETALERLQQRLDPLLIRLCKENGVAQKMDEEELGLRRSMLLGSLLQPMYPLTPAFDLRARLLLEPFRRIYIVQIVRQQKVKLANIQFEDLPF